MAEISNHVQQRWDNIIAEHCTSGNIISLTESELKESISCDLSKVNSFIESIEKRERTLTKKEVNYFSGPALCNADELPSISDTSSMTTKSGHVLCAIEKWVADNLQAWLNSHVEETDTYRELNVLITSYYASAASFYGSNPEDLSVMFLQYWNCGLLAINRP